MITDLITIIVSVGEIFCPFVVSDNDIYYFG